MVSTSTKAGKNFILTLNETTLEFYQDIFNYLNNLRGRNYILVTEHIGQPNRHYHIYIQYENTKRLSLARLHGAHVEKCFGSAQKNIDYLYARDEKHKNEGVTAVLIAEEGEPKLKGDYSIKFLEDVEDRVELPDYRMYNTWKKLRLENSNRLSLGTWRKRVQIYYIQGPSGCGKSEKAEDLIRTWYTDKGVEDENEMYFDEIKYDRNGFYSGIC